MPAVNKAIDDVDSRLEPLPAKVSKCFRAGKGHGRRPSRRPLPPQTWVQCLDGRHRRAGTDESWLVECMRSDYRLPIGEASSDKRAKVSGQRRAKEYTDWGP